MAPAKIAALVSVICFLLALIGVGHLPWTELGLLSLAAWAFLS